MIKVEYTLVEGSLTFAQGEVSEDYPTPPAGVYTEQGFLAASVICTVAYPNGAVWDNILNDWRRLPYQHAPGLKHDTEKPRHALVLLDFSRALDAVSAVGTFGARKYTDRGWLTVPQGHERYASALLRHLLAEGRGAQLDPESSLPHAAHAAWNALARLELLLREVEGGVQ